MSYFFLNLNLIILLSFLISIFSLKVKVNGNLKPHCFTKTIFTTEDTIKITFLISSGKSEKLKVSLKNKEGQILYEETDRQRGDYITDVIPSGDYTLCFYPHTKDQYYISLDMQVTGTTSVAKDLALDKEVKSIKHGVLSLEKLFDDFEKNLLFIVDRRNHHHTILKDTVGSIKTISAIKIMIIIFLSLIQVFIITKFFGTDKRVSKIKAGAKDML